MSFFTKRHDILSNEKVALRTPKRSGHELLAITPDNRFFTSLLSSATPRGWTVRWARSVNGAIGILECRTIPIVLYDWYSAVDDWRPAIRCLTLIAEAPCVILAAPCVDEILWRRALNSRVYDVVCRTGESEHLAATLQFAWKWKVERKIGISVSTISS
jgi:hypothetical protein